MRIMLMIDDTNRMVLKVVNTELLMHSVVTDSDHISQNVRPRRVPLVMFAFREWSLLMGSGELQNGRWGGGGQVKF